jgi:cold shock protein
MQSGIVKYFSEERGFGFIKPDGCSRDLFFHIRECTPLGYMPERGVRVSFEIGDDERTGKQMAVRVEMA